MEVHMKVWGEDALQQYKYKSNEAYYTFVALDPNGKPRKVPAGKTSYRRRSKIILRAPYAAGNYA